MLPWRILWKAEALLLALLVGCASIPRVPVVEDTGQGKAVVHVPRTADLQTVELEEEEFQQAVRHLAREARLTGTPRQTAETAFQMDPQSGSYLYLEQDKKLVPTGPGEPWDGTLTKEDVALAERYRLWCQSAYHFYGDCLGGALVAGRYLDMQGRYVWALAMSKSPVLDEMKKVLGELVEFRALISAALWTLGPPRARAWTPRFRSIFARAGMTLDDPANKMPLPGHYGPHPERYHQIVLDEIAGATATCRSVVVCRERLTRALKRLAEQIATPGTELNQLVTQQQPR